MTTLIELAARAGMQEMRPAGDQVLALSDMEVDYAIAGGGDTFRVERSSRGGKPVVMISDTDRATAERYLVARLAADVPSASGIPALHQTDLAAGFTLTEEPGGVRMTWASGSALFPTTRTAGSDALAFSHVATRTIDEITTLYGA
jgi:hypothetical protein